MSAKGSLFRKGDRVLLSAGKIGTVIEVVPPNNHSQAIGAFHKGRQLAVRNHESYVVAVDRAGRTKPELLWPKVSTLVAVATKAPKPKAAKHTNGKSKAAKVVEHTPSVQVIKTTRPDGTIVETKVTTTVTETRPDKLDTEFVICLDASPSIESYRLVDSILEAYNRQITAIRESAKKHGLRMPRVSLYMFGTGYDGPPGYDPYMRRVYFRVPADQVPKLDRRTYVMGNGTPLFDCLGWSLSDLLELREIDNPNLSFVVQVLTDGEENQSKRHREGRGISELLRKVFDTDRFTVAFMLPRGHKDRFLREFKFVSEGNVMEWEQTAAGAARAGSASVDAVHQYMTLRSTGARSSSNYFVQPDLSKVKAADMKQMTDLSKNFKLYEVKHQLPIKEFIEGVTKGPYVIGSAYYQLMKTEKKVQPQKNVLLRHRNSGKIFGGLQARKLIGLPTGQDAKVEPGNHADFDIFIESTSVNRILPRGTKVLHDFNQAVDKVPTWDHSVLST